jgi:hypothetical protein
MFIYKKGTTTVDEIIGHLLMRLNTDCPDTYIPIKDFCRADITDSETIDRIMATRVREKMLKYDVATSSSGTGCDEFDMVLRPNGENITSTLQWTKFVTIQDEVMAEKAKQNLLQQDNRNYGIIVKGDGNSNISQDVLERSAIKSKKEIIQIPTETPKPKSNQDIWDKLKSVAQILGFGAALLALITKLMELW